MSLRAILAAKGDEVVSIDSSANQQPMIDTAATISAFPELK
ncbi:MAG: hypothetical protein WBX05_00480 [Pseudolabrys sp.]|jgi:hypothetical protein